MINENEAQLLGLAGKLGQPLINVAIVKTSNLRAHLPSFCRLLDRGLVIL